MITSLIKRQADVTGGVRELQHGMSMKRCFGVRERSVSGEDKVAGVIEIGVANILTGVMEHIAHATKISQAEWRLAI